MWFYWFSGEPRAVPGLQLTARCWCPVSWREAHPFPEAVSALTSKHWSDRRTEMHGELWTARAAGHCEDALNTSPTFADLAFDFVTLDALQEVAGRLRGERGTHRECGVVLCGRTARSSLRPA